MSAAIRVDRELAGPFERISLSFEVDRAVGPMTRVAMLSVYRLGDTLIDSGSTRTAAALVAALDSPIRRVILTHQHEDHVGGVPALREAFGPLEVFAPAGHLELLASFDRVPWFRELYWGHPIPLSGLIGYADGARFSLGGLTLTAFETPGHTPGHMSLALEWGPQRLVLTGDLFLSARTVPAWYEGAAEDHVRSLRRVAALGPSRVLPTHGKLRDSAALELLAGTIERDAARVRAAHGTAPSASFAELAEAVFGEDPLGPITDYEISAAAFVRAVLDPVRELPAAPLDREARPGAG